MSQMTDPTIALESFQLGILQASISLERGRVDPDVYVHFDRPNGEPRFTYVRLEGKTVTALANFTPNGSIEGSPCWAVGYAVPEALRGQHRARNIVQAGIAELRNGFKGYPPFHVEAVIAVDNVASQRVAANVIGGDAENIVDSHSDEPPVRYTGKFETAR